MNVLLVGSGGREHALAWKLSRSPLVEKLRVAPGNGGTALVAENVPIGDTDVQALADYVRDNAIDFVVAGPEAPLVAGLTDALAALGVPCFGPDAYCARLEGSKAFAKEVMAVSGVPTAAFRVFTDLEAARAHVAERSLPMVVKADGLAAGKGVVVAKTRQEALDALEEMMARRVFGQAGDTVVVEDCILGEEASFLAFCDGATCAPMPSCQDHKAAGEGDTGPNTGGMGAYSPAPVLPDTEWERMADLVIRPILRTLAERGHPFKGVLYAGLMMTPDGPSVLEYNVRFGDPECQPLLMRLESDLAQVMRDCVAGKLDPASLRWSPKTALCVVLAAKGYPGDYPKGMEIRGLEAADALPDSKVFVAGAALKDGALRATGGRVLGVSALGEGLASAQENAYRAVSAVGFENSYFRRDIGSKGIKRISQ
ncbi:Phosphoribosylamine--glycine ligase [Fundidesulfovibrio magnetotacticus]|uniref:Phosphoribosylamine--glycine ligase n=1 Tax=Fundidesulfovibrio magnetotacticus TaxID=2730080 RepID=A0A6V8LT08_9BACT|nr:phosphoribosylamine--glycine ligase [Fundidesulfovibrio magnetotacticus]GFK92767.1 Phosphoribosylamine--glycine ligase [Fundidesulfovibrio magnetotacticus]